jgi:hypothetical protein
MRKFWRSHILGIAVEVVIDGDLATRAAYDEQMHLVATPEPWGVCNRVIDLNGLDDAIARLIALGFEELYDED